LGVEVIMNADTHFLAQQQSYVNTLRILNQCVKNVSNKPWGYHCFRSYFSKHTPIVPIASKDHRSQKHKPFKIFHFAFFLLSVICRRETINNDNMVNLWSLFLETSFLQRYEIKEVNSFQETKENQFI
jgi:hypothetical protein